MDVSISARHVTITPRLEEVIHEKIGQLDRYLDGLDYAGVHFDEAQNPRIADKEFCEVHLKGHGHTTCAARCTRPTRSRRSTSPRRSSNGRSESSARRSSAVIMAPASRSEPTRRR